MWHKEEKQIYSFYFFLNRSTLRVGISWNINVFWGTVENQILSINFVIN